jgi:hypothetical protein
MSGRHPLIKGYFGLALIIGGVMSSAFLCGEQEPPALMLSADPLPLSREPACLRRQCHDFRNQSAFLRITSWSPSRTPRKIASPHWRMRAA